MFVFVLAFIRVYLRSSVDKTASLSLKNLNPVYYLARITYIITYIIDIQYIIGCNALGRKPATSRIKP